ncbi:hypothetical protein CKO_05050 [Citrobacter koseri ATCC BAA-895]|uniref:Uncharacterized protein n=1 Tax=Citrobacter koseri (strain ATCC BAA-895 / CDC 4225-83 / SGSC4696) TaxID=290338 RepID=A8ARH9_CITK8|nr:hypothetical protein CKO_05050 [Citrobacter koseri ATCC BAA-895]
MALCLSDRQKQCLQCVDRIRRLRRHPAKLRQDLLIPLYFLLAKRTRHETHRQLYQPFCAKDFGFIAGKGHHFRICE